MPKTSAGTGKIFPGKKGKNMEPYQIPGNNIILTPLNEKNIVDFHELLEDNQFIEASLLYNTLYNFTYSCRQLENKTADPEFLANNRVYLILENDNQQVIGLAALSEIDWYQRRCEIILIMSRDNRKTRKAYEPLKHLLDKAVNHWGLNCFHIKIFAEDTVTATLLKSFGFTPDGEIKEYVKHDKQYFDIKIFSLKGREFRFVEYSP